ncbi:MAG: hypothetical protein ACRYFX_16305 [Janthinobacterium lividum]
MHLQNFQLYGDGISLEWEGHNLDLHNCFDFKSLDYNLPQQQMSLRWLRSPEAWAKSTPLPGLMLIFNNVTFLRVKERDPAYLLTDDTCLASISFHPVEAREEFDNIYFQTTPTDDLTFFFQSEWGIKVNAKTAELIPLAE